jgi:magnesium chelatase family protein
MVHAIHGATIFGGRAQLVRVEAQSGRGLSRTILSGMPDAVARESRERLPAALEAHGLSHPKGKVLFNLVPAQVPKQGLPLDLALATALLVADGQWPEPRQPLLCIAELDLQGRLGAPSRGLLLAALLAARTENLLLVTAPESAAEARLAPGLRVFACADLSELGARLQRTAPDDPHELAPDPPPPSAAEAAEAPRLDDVRGQRQGRQAVVLCAAGGHPLWLQGPPGTGKSMLARRIQPLLEDLNPLRALELAQTEALLGPVRALPRRPPFRAPHTSASAQALLGGGTPLRPGELARAHGGVLFLDELPEFARPALEGLRQPLEEKELRLQRAREWASFPAEVLLVATSNPCACGYLGHPRIPCRCTDTALRRYRGRVSGPLQDRFDLFVEVGTVAAEDMDGPPGPPSDEEVRALLTRTRAFQREQEALRGFAPAGSASLEALKAAGIDPRARATLREAAEGLNLSGRGILRVLRVARTGADLEQRAAIQAADVQTALSFRLLPATEEAATESGLPPQLAALLQRAKERRARLPGAR